MSGHLPPSTTHLARREEARAVSRAATPVSGPFVDDSLDPRRISSLLWQHHRLVVLIALMVVVPAMIATLLSTPLYRSTALVEISLDGASILPYPDFGPRPSGNNYLLHMTTQEELLRGPGLQARVAARLRDDPSPPLQAEARHLAERRTIEQVPNSQLFRISYLAPDPEVAATVTNLIAEQYIASRFESSQTTRTKVQEVLREELASIEQRVQESERELLDYAQAHNIQATDAGTDDLAESKLSLLARQLIDAEAEVVVARARLDTLERASPDEYSDPGVASIIEGRTATLLQLEHELTSLRSTFGENWPAVVRKRNEIAVVREQLNRERASVLVQAREQAGLGLRSAESRRDMLRAARAEQEEVVSELQGASIQYNILQREVETHKNLYEGLLARLSETGVGAGFDLGGTRIVEPARPVPRVASPSVLWNLQLATVLGLSLGVCFVLGRDFWRNSITTIEEVEQITGLPVLAPIPFVKLERTLRLAADVGQVVDGVSSSSGGGLLSLSESAGDERTVAHRQSGDRTSIVESELGSEALRSLVASILLSRSDQSPRIIAVTSAAPGEGKTTVATGLARMLAQTGARTLLVECDLRRPTFASEFGIDDRAGLSLFLAGQVDQPAIQATDEATLFVVGAGPPPPNPVVLLSSDRLGGFLREAASEYGFVIIDTPPSLPMADARMICAHADGVLLVVRSGHTPRRVLQRAQSILEVSGASILGTVLNSVDVHHHSSSYYGAYGSYGSYFGYDGRSARG